MALKQIPPPLQHPVIGRDGLMTVPWASYFRALSVGADSEIAGLTKESVGLGNVQNVDQTNAGNLTSGTVPDARLSDAALLGYALMGYAVHSGAMTDGQVVYWGGIPGEAISTTAGVSKIYIPKGGTITACFMWAVSKSTIGSGEPWPASLRINDTTDYSVQDTVEPEEYRVWGSTNLEIPVNAWDFFEFKLSNPTWATNPHTEGFGGCVYIS